MSEIFQRLEYKDKAGTNLRHDFEENSSVQTGEQHTAILFYITCSDFVASQ